MGLIMGQLDQMLEPGERTIFRARARKGRLFLAWLATVAFVFAFMVGLVWLLKAVRPESMATISNTLHLSLAGAAAFTLLFLGLLVQSEALVTNRRLLGRHGVFRHRITELALGEVKQVYGIDAGSPRPLQVEMADGGLLAIDFPQARDLARAVAVGAGLPLPDRPAPLAERAGNLLAHAATWGPLAGFFLTFLTLLAFATIDRSDPIGAIFFVLAFTHLVPAAVGAIVGWFVATFLAMLYLRPTVTAEEMRDAINVDLGPRGAPFESYDFRRPGRRMLLRFASLLYGRRIEPMSKTEDENSRQDDGIIGRQQSEERQIGPE